MQAEILEENIRLGEELQKVEQRLDSLQNAGAQPVQVVSRDLQTRSLHAAWSQEEASEEPVVLEIEVADPVQQKAKPIRNCWFSPVQCLLKGQ